MKVLHIINSLSIGGAERLLVNSIPLYKKKGITVDLLLLNLEKTLFWTELEKKSSVKITGLTSKSIYNPFLLFKIIPYLKKYDIVHSHLFPTLYWVVLANWVSFSKAKLIYTEHNSSNRRRSSFVFRILDKLVYSGLDRIVTIGDEVDFNLKAHLNFNNEKFHLIKNGIDISSFNSARGYKKADFFTENDIILIQVSGFREQKDQKTLIKSLQYLSDDIRLLLIGDGELIDESKSLVRKLKLTSRVKFLGNRTDVARLLNTSDIIVLSSKYEGASLSNIEGMSVGKPFIGSDVPGLREIVKGHGVLFPQGDEKNLAMRISELLTNPTYYHEVATSCLARAKEFDTNTMILQHIQLYNDVRDKNGKLNLVNVRN